MIQAELLVRKGYPPGKILILHQEDYYRSLAPGQVAAVKRGEYNWGAWGGVVACALVLATAPPC